MTTAYSVTVDPAQLAEATSLFKFVGGNTDEALRVAINQTTPRTRTASSRLIREQVRLKAGYVSERLTIIKATRKALSGRISAQKRGLLLTRFSTDPLIAGDKVGWIRPPSVPPQGIRVKVKPTGSPQVVEGGPDTAGNKPFYMVLNKGQNIGIAARLTGTRKVKVFHGPSLSQVFDDVRRDVTPQAQQIFRDELIDAMRYILAKKYPPQPSV